MEIGIAIGCCVLAGGLYELFRPGRRRQNFNNNNFMIFYDIYGNRHVLKLDSNIRVNSIEEIDKYTKSYISNTDLGLCTISQEEITDGTLIRELNCGHFFKKDYIDKWLHENNVCPMCRKNFKN